MIRSKRANSEVSPRLSSSSFILVFNFYNSSNIRQRQERIEERASGGLEKSAAFAIFFKVPLRGLLHG